MEYEKDDNRFPRDTHIDYSHVFYVEAILHDSSFPQISRIKPIFQNITKDEFIAMVGKLIDENDHETFQQFLYFLLLFREMKHLQDYINSDEFGQNGLERLVIFVYGYCMLHGHSVERIIDEILGFLTQDRLLELVLNSAHISRDKMLLFFILTRFDIDMLNRYFARVRNVPEFIQYFLRLPEEVLRSIISRNYHLFQYIMLMIAETASEEYSTEEFYRKYSEDISQFSRLNDLVRNYREKINHDDDRDKPFQQRDMTRISFLVNMVRDLPDPGKAIEYFYGEGIFIDETEKTMVHAIVTSPLLKNTFVNYDRTFDII
ncbi:MAG: hypothetical protein CVV44_14340 [Spirochaetae bacterium HGW-Spirochaetae-1]|nr:MAG: hypothetical protein CVV44_14340 [Spirochaetae bacterium HGW-Spirochaetae-1]